MSDALPTSPIAGVPVRRRYVRAIGPRLRVLLNVVFGLFAILGANSFYLTTITALNWLESKKNVSYENYFYQLMFLAHLGLGVLITLPVVIFGVVHMLNTYQRPNRKTVYVGYALLVTALVLLFTGFGLMRFAGFEIRDPASRSVLYWLHVLTPMACVWLYVLHRLSGPRIRWRYGLTWAAAVVAVVLGMVALLG